MKVAFYTLGCKVNQYETQVLTEQFAAAGYEIVPSTAQADLYVVNSCTVTATGDQKTRQVLRRLKKQNPAARVALTGCFPQAFPEAAALLPEADIITGTRDRGRLLALAEEQLAQGKRLVQVRPHERGEAFEPMRATGAGEHARAFVKIEDGCERYCAYCIIPTARGPVRSKSPDQLKSELETLVAAGYREVVLTGINLSAYGTELGLHLADALETACATRGIERVRLGSLEPELFTDEAVARMSLLRQLCPQFHLSLQSGCDATLRRMNRHYDTAEYARIVASLRRHFENCAITTDLMVGFPGETEAEFEISRGFAEHIGFARTHVFAYSPRPGTKAAEMPDQLSDMVKAARSARMQETTDRCRAAFWQTQIGSRATVLFERRMQDGLWEGYSENYTPVRTLSEEDLRGQTRRVLLDNLQDEYCAGQLLKKERLEKE